MSDIKHSLSLVDAEILQDLVLVAQTALNDSDTVSRVAQEISLSEDHLTVLASVAEDLLDENKAKPSVTTRRGA